MVTAKTKTNAPKVEKKTAKAATSQKSEGLIALVRIRGRRNLKPQVIHTFKFLRLNRVHHCSIYRNSPQLMGMIQKVKDYIAYGPVSEATVFALLKKRGECGSMLLREKKTEEEIRAMAAAIATGSKKVKDFVDPVFRLHPPRRGYKNIKAPFPRGDLGSRPDMDILLKRMM